MHARSGAHIGSGSAEGDATIDPARVRRVLPRNVFGLAPDVGGSLASSIERHCRCAQLLGPYQGLVARLLASQPR